KWSRGAGGITSAARAPASSSAPSNGRKTRQRIAGYCRDRRLRLCRHGLRAEVELHGRRLVGAGGRGEIGPHCVAEHAGENHGAKRFLRGVVSLHPVVE